MSSSGWFDGSWQGNRGRVFRACYDQGWLDGYSDANVKKQKLSGKYKLWLDAYTTEDKPDLEKFPRWLCWNDSQWVPYQETVQDQLRQLSNRNGFDVVRTISVHMGDDWDYKVTVWPAACAGLVDGETLATVEGLKEKFPNAVAGATPHEHIVGLQQSVRTQTMRPVKVVLQMPMPAI